MERRGTFSFLGWFSLIVLSFCLGPAAAVFSEVNQINAFGAAPRASEATAQHLTADRPAERTVNEPLHFRGSQVNILQDRDGFRLYRNGSPYFIKGVGGKRHLATAAMAGANSVRTWGAHMAGEILDKAEALQMSVLVGFWLSQAEEDYYCENYRNTKIDEIRDVVARYKTHPALLMWSLGNEINLKGAGTAQAWRFVNQLAALIKAEDPDHPVITVISFDTHSPDLVARWAPDLDALGINAYGEIAAVRRVVEASAFKGPYLITEWGVDGYWEAPRTIWGSPIEPTSAAKADHYLRRYADDILAHRDRCLGSYVFLWGQKQERTATWFSMFVETIPGLAIDRLSSPAVDAMGFNWSGRWPLNRAPAVTSLTLNNASALNNITLAPDEHLRAEVSACDPDNDRLTYIWELLQKPLVLNTGGGYEPRPPRIGEVLAGGTPLLTMRAPSTPGAYRLFVYVCDENGHVGTANIPFQVKLAEEIYALADHH